MSLLASQLALPLSGSFLSTSSASGSYVENKRRVLKTVEDRRRKSFTHLLDGNQTNGGRYVILMMMMVMLMMIVAVMTLAAGQAARVAGAGRDGRGFCVAIHGKILWSAQDDGRLQKQRVFLNFIA